jgi:DNA-binding transcriptional LysR family regulator
VAEDYALLVPKSAEGESWRDIMTQWPFIRYDRTSFGGRQVDRFLRREGVIVNEWLEVDDLSAMVALVESGAGCAIVPMTEVVNRLPSSVRRVTLGPDAPSRPVGIVHQSPNTTAMVAELIACLVATGPQ